MQSKVVRNTHADVVGLVVSSVASRTPGRRWACRIESGAQTGLGQLLGDQSVIIGAGSECDLAIDDPSVSKRHLELTLVDGAVRVRDLSSTNGTYWQGSRVTEVTLNANAILRLGNTSLRIARDEPRLAPPSNRGRFGGLVGESLIMREVFGVLEVAAPTDATVLIEGESGTGKEGAARAIHEHSARAEGPFVVVDCGAAPEALIESLLFGHLRGAFTGAISDRKGAFLEAAGGTLFLDEIGDLPAAAQVRLLRAVEERTVQPVGSNEWLPADVRLIAATHRDLNAMVNAGTFRFDLYHRLAVVHVRLPALREHLEDLPLLVQTLYEHRGVDGGPITGDNLTKLQQFDWPGNVRQLRNVMERALVLSGGRAFADLTLAVEATRFTGTPGPEPEVNLALPFKEAKEQVVATFERRYVQALLAAHGNNISRAAEQAGINRGHFRELMQKHGLYDK